MYTFSYIHFNFHIFLITLSVAAGQDSSVGIAIRFGLKGPGIDSRPDRPWGPPSLLYNGSRVLPGSKVATAWP